MTNLQQQLKKLCYVRSGSGTTANQKIIIVKNQTDENVEAADLLVRALFPKVIRSSRGTYTAGA
jgi:hypothetical protein